MMINAVQVSTKTGIGLARRIWSFTYYRAQNHRTIRQFVAIVDSESGARTTEVELSHS
jgi:hypothetical protein